MKVFGKNNNNENNRKLKLIGNITLAIDHNPRNRWMGESNSQSICYLSQVMYYLLLGFRVVLGSCPNSFHIGCIEQKRSTRG